MHLGVTYLFDLIGIQNDSLLSDDRVIQMVLISASMQAGLTPHLRTYTEQEFSAPDGQKAWSACLILSESHISIHTYPENRYARVELSSCRKLSEAEETDVVSYLETLGKCKVRMEKHLWQMG